MSGFLISLHLTFNVKKMKKTSSIFICLFALAATLMMMATGCTKNAQQPLESLSNGKSMTATGLILSGSALDSLIAYKNSPHQLMMGYYRTWGDYVTDPVNYHTRMTDLPDSIDIVSVFTDYTPATNPYWDTLKLVYIPYLHARGTKVVYTGGYFAGASTNPTGLATWVNGIVSTINTYNYDGYDIDIEATASGTTLQDQIACFQALSQYLGPLSGTGKLLIYDTNQNGNALMSGIKNMVSYVLLQAYWRNVTSLQGTFNTYTSYISPSKFLVGVDYEDATGYQAGQMPAYTAWQPTQGTKGGVFAYGIDMEGPNSGRNYVTTRAAIQTMNPAAVYFYQNTSYAGTISQPLAKGNYTTAQLAAAGVSNNWASSVKVPVGWTVIMYDNDNFTGTSWTLTTSNSSFSALSPSANDKMSSVKIQ